MTNAHGVARDQLRAFVERIERLEEEKKTIADDIKDVYGEAKSMGFDTKILKKVIALRKKDEQERTEEEMILDTYLQALGMIPQFEMFDPKEVRPSREERRRQLMTEDMADHKTLIDEMADAGLISEEARHENKALADAVATKFGNGHVSAKPLQSPRKAAEAVSERAAINPVAKASVDNAATIAPETATAGREMRVGAAPRGTVPATSDGGRDGSERRASNLEMDRDGLTGNADEAVPAENARKAVPETEDGSVTHAGAGESPATESAPATQGEAEAPGVERVSPQADDATTGSAAANTGGDHVTAHPNNAATADGLVRHTPSATFILRPNCLRPECCAGHGTNHCHACKVAARESEAA